MIIESQDALKEWLTSVLEPLCDADPTALAKYVIALVKKDKNINELRETCVDQLDVFLQHETKPFVELLFKSLEDKTYLVKAENNVNTTTVQSSSSVTDTVTNANSNSTTTVSTSLPTNSINNATKVTERRSSRPESGADDDRDSKRVTRKSARSHSRSRSGSRGRNRSRSRSRDRDDRRIRRFDDDRRRRGIGGRRYDRYNDYRRDRSRDRLEKKRSLSRSRSRSRSHSRNRDRNNRSRGDSTQKASSSPSHDHGDTDYRFGGSNSNNASNSTGTSQPPSTTSTSTSVTNTDTQSFAGRTARRCRDYDEKGYCMRGDLCPYDHGADPVVVEEVHLPTVLAYGGGVPAVPPGTTGPGRPAIPANPRASAPPSNILPTPLLGPPIPHPRPLSQPPVPVHPVPNPYIPEPYNPEAPGMDRLHPRMRPPFWGPRLGIGRMPVPRPLPPYPHATRELISVPTVDANNGDDKPNKRVVVAPQKRPFDDSQNNSTRVFRSVGNTNEPLMKRRLFDHNRLGTRKFNGENACLQLRKIPQGLNCITQLNNHFSRFGKIVNLQVCYEGDPEAALIQFSSHAEAHAAHRSTEAVLNNRFIKVFWHNKDSDLTDKEENSGNAKKLSAKERLGIPPNKTSTEQAEQVQSSENTEKSSVILSTSGTLSKTVFNPAALKKCNLTGNNSVNSSQVLTAQETIKKKQAEQRKEAMKIKVDLQKRKQDLLHKQIQQQKVLIEKLEKNKNMTPIERSTIMKTLKLLQDSIEKLKSELVATTQVTSPKTKQEAQREILDIEMDMYNKQHQGADTTALRKKVADLKSEAMSLGLIEPKNFGVKVVNKRIGRGGFRGRGRGSMNSGVRSVDHRPKRLQVSGFDEEEKEEVVKHFAQFGEIENIEPCEDKLQLILTYRTRREAELAVAQGTKFKGKVLILSWYRAPSYGGISGSGLVGTDGLAVEDDAFDAEVDADDLLLADDDEEEDSEARSWRR